MTADGGPPRPRDRSPIPEPDESTLPPRYCPQRALPAYRFVPGLDPHPVIDPAGHSYGKPESSQRPLPPGEWPRNEEYLYGVDLFNRRYYWEAHEAWESAWRACDRDSAQGQFLQGLILIAAALRVTFGFLPAPPPGCPGDADGSGVVDFADVSSVLANWGATGPAYRPGDGNGDGVVNFADVSAVLEHWGDICA